MNKIIFSILIIFLSFIQCQPTKPLVIQNIEVEDKIYEFPKEWIGEWEGQLKIYNAKGKTTETYMGLDILPLGYDKYTFVITYGEGEEKQQRIYEIYAKDAETGHYMVDEKNFIVLDNFLLGNTLYSRFEVMGNLLLASYERGNRTITFEVVFGNVEPINETGGVDSIPKVNSYKIGVAQKAILKRKQECLRKSSNVDSIGVKTRKN